MPQFPENPFKLEVVSPPEALADEAPKLRGVEADEVLSLKVTEGETIPLDELMRSRPQMTIAVLNALAGRDLKNELPVEEASLGYRRNLQECGKLQRVVKRIETKTKIDPNNPVDMELLRTGSRLLALELKKAEWLEKEFYPVVFRRAFRTAIGEVNQFLIKEKNLRVLDRFTDPEIAQTQFVDELNYLLHGHKPESAGDYRQGIANIRMPETFTDRDEWRVYNVIVHELLHHVSFQEMGRLGMRRSFEEPEYKELNEAVTEILAFTIANRHLEKGKTPLKGERQQPNLLDKRAYSEYTVFVKQIFKKVPLESFIDAMLNREGMDRLRNKFTEAFGDERALIDYGKKLRDMYLPPEKRRAQSEPQADRSEPRGQLIPLKRRQKPSEAGLNDAE